MTATASATFTARSPEDLLAVVPAVLGFHPSESLVMLTFGGRRSFHARVDLPVSPGDLDAVVGTLLAPALRQRPQQVLFIAYAADAVRGAQAALRASDAFLARDFGVLAPLRSDGTCWYAVRPDADPLAAQPHPYDVTAHELTARSVLDGRVTLASRAALEASLAADPDAVARVEECIEAAMELQICSGADPASIGPAPADVRRMVLGHVAAGTQPADQAKARLLLALRRVPVRDAAFDGLTRESAEKHAEFWRGIVTHSPELLVAPPAAILGFCAWLAGHGALAWCAVDRARAAEPDYALALLVGDLLEGAVPPSAWAVVRPRSAPEA